MFQLSVKETMKQYSLEVPDDPDLLQFCLSSHPAAPGKRGTAQSQATSCLHEASLELHLPTPCYEAASLDQRNSRSCPQHWVLEQTETPLRNRVNKIYVKERKQNAGIPDGICVCGTLCG